MSELEKHLEEEVERVKQWREGRHFHLETFNVPEAECKRCRQLKPHVFIVSVRTPVAWSETELPISAPVPEHENVCRDCLSDSEIAALLLPALHFVMTVLLRDWQDPAIGDSDLLRSLDYVRSYLGSRSHILMRSDRDQKEFALRALEGLKGLPLPAINFVQLYKDLENTIARDMFFAANPEDVADSIEAARQVEEKVHLFFHSCRASVQSYALRDSVMKCIEIFRKYFTRSSV